MSDKKIIAVFGATGAQGGGLARAILNNPQGEFTVRAITRNPDSDKARELARLGAELAAADIDNPQSLGRALAGAYGAFCVTNFWEHFSPERELQQARNMAEAAKAAGLQHVIWSTLEDTRHWVPLSDNRMPTLQGHYKVPHFDAKGEANRYFSDLGVPTTFMLTAFYWENFIYFGMGVQRNNEGKLVLSLPLDDKKMACIASEDIGRCAHGIFNKGAAAIGQTIGITGGLLTGTDMAQSFSKALGQEVVYQPVPPEVYRGLGFPGADDLGNMFQFYQEFEEHFVETRREEVARELNPALQNFDQWLAQNAQRLPALNQVAEHV
ncbi:NmrA/HSCARG family protein [Solirubrum puertoriconensis]|uniref:Nucleoside-diphosphate sugar epimerase n=1 Tax=Solirubrum puertoriconensis TaxID=1751427 RepID=A0A9X0L5K9_SOLP1|nr:NmrA/HSCARG family protein [Solirubrum puertoriconensis]KUG08808.1 nucleoside-diphosphate sugar epimerase [Solirubrum puertoriconensis]